jgi:hypothetical protein
MSNKSVLRNVQDYYNIENGNIDITDNESGLFKQDTNDYDTNLDQLKNRNLYKSPLGNNFENPYNQTKIGEITTDKEKEELLEKPDEMLRYAIANFKRRINKYNSKF